MAKARKLARKILWMAEVEDHDYPAAESYLSLIHPPAEVRRLVAAFRKAPVVEFKAKDIFRASSLSLLGVSNLHVDRDHRKIRKGEALAPILLVRHPTVARVIVADGYHRLCAIYQLDEDAVVRCKIV